jgi:hypothetical protein
VVEWASGGTFKHGDIGRMTGADVPKLQAATDHLGPRRGGSLTGSFFLLRGYLPDPAYFLPTAHCLLVT